MSSTVLTNTNPFSSRPWEAFIGNGYIGQRISTEGDYSFFNSNLQRPGFWDDRPFPSGSAMNGLWGPDGLEYLPLWCTLKIGIGRNSAGSAYVSQYSGRYSRYRQDMNLRNGTVTTEAEWTADDTEGDQLSLEYTTRVYLARHQRNSAIIETVITPRFNGWVVIEDFLDGSMCRSPLALWDKNPGRIMSLKGVLGESRRSIEIFSLTDTPRQDIPRYLTHPHVKIPSVDFRMTDRGIRKMIYLTAEENKPLVIRKIVGIYSDQDRISEVQLAENRIDEIFSNEESFYEDHRRTWSRLWESRIDTDNKKLQETSDLILYLFYSQLDEERSYALGPLGITGGECWKGRLFWDGDLWMFPGINLMNPPMAKGFVQMRSLGLEGAKENAAREGRGGARFAWESTDTGYERCTGHEINQIHLNSAVSLAHEKYYLASGDLEFRNISSLPLYKEVVEYWLERISFNTEKDRYEIKSVSCPDEFSGIVDNNSLTNFGAVRDITRLMEIYRGMGITYPPEWTAICDKMYFPRDANGILKEYEKYNGHTIKQADTTLMIYPYGMEMGRKETVDLVEYYSGRREKKGIMMSDVIDGIIHGQLGNPEMVWNSFEKALEHFHGPFMVSTETPVNNNQWFMTGLGGLLQLILMGMAGIRQTGGGIEAAPCLPEEVSKLNVSGVHHLGEKYCLKIERKGGKTLHLLEKC